MLMETKLKENVHILVDARRQNKQEISQGDASVQMRRI